MKLQITKTTKTDYEIDLGEYRISAWALNGKNPSEITVYNGKNSKRNYGSLSIDNLEDAKKIVLALNNLIDEFN